MEKQSSLISRIWPHIFAVIAALVFLDSLRYKFTDNPHTEVIFHRLDEWAHSLGAGGLFTHTGLFSQYVIGTAELIASLFLLVGILPPLRRLQGFGALIGLAVMSGAVSFHVFTPLGINPNSEGPGLFALAVLVWWFCLVLTIIRRRHIGSVIGATIRAIFVKPI